MQRKTNRGEREKVEYRGSRRQEKKDKYHNHVRDFNNEIH